MKKLVISLFFISSLAFGQSEVGSVKKIDGKNYYEYSVKKGDSWYSIARKFKISYAELKLANKKSDGKLITGKPILIPADKLKANDPFFEKNHTDKPAQKPGSMTKHKVASSETLFAISKKYKVSVDAIKKQNKLQSNSIHKGQVLVIPSNSESTQTEETTEPKETKVNTIDRAPVNAPKPEIPEEKKDHSQDSATKPVPRETTTDKSQKEAEVIFANGRQQVTETGVASWIDDEDINPGKYYALHRTAPIGTIIRITNRMNNKSIFVKVVGKLPDTGDNEGLIIKISKASAEKLGVLDQRFQSQLLYGLSGNESGSK
ncbi:MAG: LysM peptidoglycan-binding domain-containing protein [Bacteroidetes bacterium]|nr:LysM peptidoglycan-binding domain-containing protein [Bacteroidota bacterium]